jgi:hypothetical protein
VRGGEKPREIGAKEKEKGKKRKRNFYIPQSA